MANASTINNSRVQHHFRNADQQFSSSKLGMWLFLFTEVMFFGGLFVAYIIYRAWNPELFTMAATELDTLFGAVNTAVLIGSSLTCALAIRAAQTDNTKMVVNYLLITIALATLFLVIKYFEYTAKIEIGILPGAMYTFEGIDHPKASVFFSIYYMMTGLHGLHVVIGIGLMIWLVIRAKAGDYNSAYYTPVEITGLYWHLVDIIWIFLFPLMYLID
ncbi:MAG: cytochrome c oxidase subunit 3 family protein [Balneolales bacterium]|nr:cytochrome c oxidase subunit 3 family protein [Balneolales bacterium]